MSEQFSGQNPTQPPNSGYGVPGQPNPGYGMQGQPGGPPVPGQMSESDVRLWSMLAHFGAIVLGFIAPLVVLLAKGSESPRVRAEAVESLNFQITVAIGWVVAIVLAFLLIGFLLFPVLWIGNLVLCIMAGIKAKDGIPYRYPFALRLVS